MTTVATRSNNYFNEINYNNCNYIIRTTCSEGLRITIETTHCVVATIFLTMRVCGYLVTMVIALPNWVFSDSIVAKSTIIPFKMVEFTCDHLEHVILQIIHRVSDLLQQPNSIPVSRLTLARTLQVWQEEAPEEPQRVTASDRILNTCGTSIGWEPLKTFCSIIPNFNMQIPPYYRVIISIVFNMLNGDFSKHLFESSEINLRDLELHSLPPIFDHKNFQYLSYLYLQNNRLIELPPSIINLSLKTSVIVYDNDFSEEYVEELTEIRNRTNNRLIGLYPMRQSVYQRASSQATRRNVDFNVLGSAYRTTLRRDLDGRIPANIGKFRNNDCVILWLNKLTETSDVRRSRAVENFIVTNVVSYLQEANQDPEFEQIFIANINEGAGSCGDRVSLSILRLDLAYQLHKADLSNLQNLVHLLLNGIWTLELLQECAMEKIRSLRNRPDEIEVMLGYAIRLKTNLSIPITIETMLFPSLSSLTFSDLQRAKNVVLSCRNNLDRANDFLFEQPQWMNALHHNYSETMKNLQDREQAEREELEDRYGNSYPPIEEYANLTPHRKKFSKEILSQFYHPTS